MQASLYLFVGVESDRATGQPRQSNREWRPQLASERLIASASVQAELQVMELSFAHNARESEQKAVVVGARVVEPLGIGDECFEQPAQFQQSMPIAAVSRQA